MPRCGTYTSAVVSLSKKHLAQVDPAVLTGECEATLVVLCSLSKTPSLRCYCPPRCTEWVPGTHWRGYVYSYGLDPHENLCTNLVGVAIQGKLIIPLPLPLCVTGSAKTLHVRVFYISSQKQL